MNIPNEPSDDEKEAEALFAKAFHEEADKHYENGLLPQQGLDKLREWCWQQIGNAYHVGYEDGLSDEGLARELNELKNNLNGDSR